jgi:hypothetical protein
MTVNGVEYVSAILSSVLSGFAIGLSFAVFIKR